jgi:hypothetical protein
LGFRRVRPDSFALVSGSMVRTGPDKTGQVKIRNEINGSDKADKTGQLLSDRRRHTPDTPDTTL